MARIRSIKPEFVQSETIGNLSRDARLLFIQLWTYVDDEGRARGASRMLASLLFPYDHDAPNLIEGWLTELQREGCIRRYEVDGSRYLDIPNWLKHQKIDHPGKSKIPPFENGSEILAKVSEGFAPDLGPRTRDLGEGSSEANASADVPPAPKPMMPKDRVWSEAPTLAVLANRSEGSIRSYLGKCLSKFPAETVEAAVIQAIAENTGDPCGLITRILKPAENRPRHHTGPPRPPSATDVLAAIVQNTKAHLGNAANERPASQPDYEIIPPNRRLA